MERAGRGSFLVFYRFGCRAAVLLLGGAVATAADAGSEPGPPAAPPTAQAALCVSQSNIGGLPTILAEWAVGAQLFAGLGTFQRGVSTRSKTAQAYFDQGMRYLWAFNHDEATRSFAEAAQDDPQCAMCYWGVALTVGPNYNLPMIAEPRAQVAWEALQLAEQNIALATPVEQALIQALSRRYRGPEPLDPSNGAYCIRRGDAGRRSKIPG
jgi:hypothetical protein